MEGELVIELMEVCVDEDGFEMVNGLLCGSGEGKVNLYVIGYVLKFFGDVDEIGLVGFVEFFFVLYDSEVVLWKKEEIIENGVDVGDCYIFNLMLGVNVFCFGNYFSFKGIRSDKFID